jgi:hypothetical protein
VTNTSYSDFGNIWRDLLRQWEDVANSLGGDAMKTAEFSKAMNQATNLSMVAQNAFAQALSTYLAALNLPTRSDVTAIAERLRTIEQRIDEIRLVMSDPQKAGLLIDQRTKPSRNRRPASAAESALAGEA